MRYRRILNKMVILPIAILIANSTVALGVCNDIKGHWAEGSIRNTMNCERKVIKGYPDKSFRPDKKITREEVASMLSRYISREEGECYQIRDVKGRWSEGYINSLIQLGIVSGYKDGTFRSERKITRAEFSYMVMKYMELEKEIEMDNGFYDIRGHWAEEAIKKLSAIGLVSGYKDGSFRAESSLTRAEVATIICNLAKYESPSINVIPFIKSIDEEVIEVRVSQSESNLSTRVMDEVNKMRRAAGIRELVWDDYLGEYAYTRAVEIESLFSHTRADGSGALEPLIALGWYCGENIAYNYSDDPEEVNMQWYNSPGHKENMMNPRFTKIGVGYYSDGEKSNWVEIFQE